MVCCQEPVRYHVRRTLQCVTKAETRVGWVPYTEFRILPMKMVFKGENWSPEKRFEFFEAAVNEFAMNNPSFTHRDWLKLVQPGPTSPGFAEGKDHAEGVFFATHGLISPNSMDPLVVRAREAARNMPPPSDLATGMLWCTVREFLRETFPAPDPNAAPF